MQPQVLIHKIATKKCLKHFKIWSTTILITYYKEVTYYKDIKKTACMYHQMQFLMC